MKTDYLKVSIVIPTYNRAELLKEAVASVVAQSYKNWELLVIDDGSTDHTTEVINSYIDEDKRIFYLKNERKKGAQGARNTGVLAAKGDYIILLDSDDLLAPICLQQRLDFVLKNIGLDFYVFPTAIFNKEPSDSLYLWNFLNTETDDLIRFLKQDMPYHTCGVLWKKTSLIDLGLMDEELPCWQEWDIYVRALIANLSYTKAPDELFFIDSYFRSHQEESISKHTKKVHHLQSISLLIEKTALLLRHNTLINQKNIYLELIRLSARHCFQLIVHHQKQQEANFFFKNILNYVPSPELKKSIWIFYLSYRFNKNYPQWLRKCLDGLKLIHRDFDLFDNQNTFTKAKYLS